MGIGDKFNELKGKAQQALGEHSDKVDGWIDRASQFADQKTGGKHSEKIQKGTEKLKGGLNGLAGKDQ
jgi:hypothetical protein